jgi:hypothetical protein
MRTSPAVSAAPNACAPDPSARAAAKMTVGSPVSSAAAASSSVWVGSGRWRTRSRNTRSTPALTGSGSGSGSRPASWSAFSDAGSSSNASGLPWVASIRRSRTAGARPSGDRSVSSAPAASASRPVRRSSWRPGAVNGWVLSSRAANSSTTPSASSRRAAKVSASADGWSSHCASSTRQTNGRSSATSASRLSAPTPIRKRSSPWAVASPNAP